MGKVVVSEFVTLDGVMEDPGGAEGFERGGWAFQFDRGQSQQESGYSIGRNFRFGNHGANCANRSWPIAQPRFEPTPGSFAHLKVVKQNEARAATTSERAVKWAVIAVAAVTVFGGLYFAIQVLA